MTQNNHHFLHMTAETLGRSLLEGLIQEIRIMPDCWHKLSQSRQNDVIERLQKQITHAVGRAVYMIASDDRKTAYGKLESVAIKDKMKAVIVINPNSPCKHDMLDAVEQDCLIILGSADEYLGGMDMVEGEPDQNPLDLNGGDDDLEDSSQWDRDVEVEEASFVEVAPPLPGVEKFGGHTYGDICRWLSISQPQLSIAKLQARFAITSEQAQRLISMLLADGVIEADSGDDSDPDSWIYSVVKDIQDIDPNME